MTYLRPDSKSQITLEYNDDQTPAKITDIVVSTQHDEFDTEEAMQNILTICAFIISSISLSENS